jgi:hypothetical protein
VASDIAATYPLLVRQTVATLVSVRAGDRRCHYGLAPACAGGSLQLVFGADVCERLRPKAHVVARRDA